MKTLLLAVVLLFVAGRSSRAEAGLEVAILGMPTAVFSFEPVPVLFEVKNVGHAPLLVPATADSETGAAILTAAPGRELRARNYASGLKLGRHAPPSMWLEPGERWLFLQDISIQFDVLEGSFDVVATFSSSGKCGTKLMGGRASLSLDQFAELLEPPSEGHADPVYGCWSGQVRSAASTVRVVRSTKTVDIDAETFLLANRQLESSSDGSSWQLGPRRDVVAKFPSSPFAYAVLARDATSVPSMVEAVRLQPGNPLNVWVNALIAQRVLDFRSTCWSGQKIDFDVSIDSLELAPGAREYLDQYAWNLESRICPLEREAEAEKRRRSQK